MDRITTDVAVIGAGTAGMTAYRAVQRAGKRPLLIESGPYGTMCARVGCMPSKLLIAAGEAAHAVGQASKFGVFVDGAVRVDGVAVMKRVRQERDRFAASAADTVAGWPADTRLRGRARFSGPRQLVVDDRTIVDANAIVIATGTVPVIPPLLRELGDRVVVNDDVFDWTDLPRSVAVFGAGAIGIELGQSLARLGVTVKVFGRGGALAGLSDPEVRQAALSAWGAEFPLDPDARVTGARRDGDGILIDYVGLDGRPVSERFDYALAAAGRRADLQSLDVAQAGIVLNDRGLPDVDPATLQIAALPVFIAGDASGYRPLQHEAADEGSIAGRNAARFPDVEPAPRRAALSIGFADPQVTMVGLRHAQIEAGRSVTGVASFANQGRSRVVLKNQGLLHVYAQRDGGQLLGAEMVGPAAEHIGHLLAWALQQRMTIRQMLEMPFYHPVIEEALRTALRDAAARLVAESLALAASPVESSLG